MRLCIFSFELIQTIRPAELRRECIAVFPLAGRISESSEDWWLRLWYAFIPTPLRTPFPLSTLNAFNLLTYLPMTIFVYFLIDIDINGLENSVISASEEIAFRSDIYRVLILDSSLGLNSFWVISPSFPYYLNVTASRERLSNHQSWAASPIHLLRAGFWNLINYIQPDTWSSGTSTLVMTYSCNPTL